MYIYTYGNESYKDEHMLKNDPQDEQQRGKGGVMFQTSSECERVGPYDRALATNAEMPYLDPLSLSFMCAAAKTDLPLSRIMSSVNWQSR